ncbi:serine/threonine-protein kinase [Planobispora rosea]|nr:serine/threonine-protein kinase [Planobispora rosea]
MLSVIGQGGMGTVWLARDERLRREVAVKQLLLPPGRNAAGTAQLRERMEREALAMAQVRHRGIVTVHDVLAEDDQPWIVMEYLRADSLDEFVRSRGPLPPRLAAEMGGQVLDALVAVHQSGILHRDIKPSNVLLTRDGQAVITDFGIATFDGAATLTESGQVIGSPAYMAPEVVNGHRATAASDLWSLGATLFFTVEGRSPYQRETAVAVLAALIIEEPPTPENAGLLGPAIASVLRRDPTERASAAELALLLGAAAAPAGAVPSRPDPERTVRVRPAYGATPDRSTPVKEPGQSAPALRNRRSGKTDQDFGRFWSSPVKWSGAKKAAAALGVCALAASVFIAWLNGERDDSSRRPTAVSATPAPKGTSVAGRVPTLRITCVLDTCAHVLVRAQDVGALLDRELTAGEQVQFFDARLDVVLEDASLPEVDVNGVPRDWGKPGERQEFSVTRE